METFEHIEAGDQIRIETQDNPYFEGSKTINPNEGERLQLTMMQQVDGVPVPLDLKLTAGEVVAMAGDYYSKAGWGYELDLFSGNSQDIFKGEVSENETLAFQSAYHDLASPQVTRKDIDKIKQIEKTTYIPFFSSLNNLVQQLVYSFTVKDYGKKLVTNADHFVPWSTRAYMVGHKNALHMAQLAACCHQLAEGKLNENGIPQALRHVLENIANNRDYYQFKKDASMDVVYKELAHRYHALAVAQDLYTMHFYSDHFAGGHLGRIGLLRTKMAEQFGNWGSILVNNMHNEDNRLSVAVHNPFQPNDESLGLITMPHTQTQGFGDDNYDNKENEESRNLLVNGMTNSLGDITRVMNGARCPDGANYGGLSFLSDIDASKEQAQPMFIDGLDGIYFRSKIEEIQPLTPEQYQATLNEPAKHGYEALTPFKAFILVIELRLFGFIYEPKLVKPMQVITQEAAIEVKEPTPLVSVKENVLEEGVEPAWRNNRRTEFFSCTNSFAPTLFKQFQGYSDVEVTPELSATGPSITA